MHPVSKCLDDACEVTIKKTMKGKSVLDHPCANYTDPECPQIKTGNKAPYMHAHIPPSKPCEQSDITGRYICEQKCSSYLY